MTMLLQELKAFAERNADKLPPAGYNEYTVTRVIEVDLSGNLLVPPAKTKVEDLRLPYSGSRTGTASRPALLADKAEYALGLGDDKKFEDFRRQVAVCARETGLATVNAVENFLG
jgi:hypothetical protein